MFTRNTEADKRIANRVFDLWRKAQTKQLEERSESLYNGLTLLNPHGYESRNELDD